LTRAVLTATCLLLLGASTALADDTLWTRRYAGDHDCYAQTVLTDQEDNIIVVGTCLGAGTGNDIGVVKYSSDGTQQWFVTIAGSGSNNDEAKGAGVDTAGNIYVTGSSGLFPDYDILTVKLTPSGTEVWRRVYAGEGGKADVPAGIVVDSAGNAYVTGYTTAANGLTDWVTMKHLPGTGLPAWVVVRPGEGGGMDRATAIALGPDGSPYVTGRGELLYMEDYITVKYDTAGVEQWKHFYNYSGNGTDMAVAIAVDEAGDAYVTGTSSTAPPPDGLSQYATVKYANDTGAQVWVARYTGTGAHNLAAAIALGASEVYVTGSSQGDTGDYDYATIAYDKSSGSELWATHDPHGNAVDLAVLPSGKILVTGTSYDANDKGGFMTLRYTEAGVQDWASSYCGPPDGDNVAAAVASDNHCNPIVIGSVFDSGYYGILIVKYDSAAVGGIAERKPVVPARPGMRLAPNPARSWTNLQHSLSGATPAVISLLGVDGRIVRTQRFDGRAGVQSRLDLTGLAPGVYVVRLESGGRSATQKLVVQQ
jgi:hypothetical protein